jgi:predicted nucleic acid-binding protein
LSKYFLDSSALVKRYIEESGSGWVREITAPDGGHVIVVARIAPVEIVSSVMRRLREGLLDEQAASETRLLVDLDTALEYRLVALSEDVVRRA